MHEDGTSTLNGTNAFSKAMTDSFISGGSVTDKYGTSIVVPGEPLGKNLYVFGSHVGSIADLIKMHDKLQANAWAHHGDLADALGFPFSDAYGNETQSASFMLGFLAQHNAATYSEEKAAILALLGEMAGASSGLSTAGEEPVFLKSAPAGIKHASDIFEFGTSGYAKPVGGGLSPITTWGTTALMKNQVKFISEHHGGGKVVGTHTSSMGAGPLSEWLKAWVAGDMVTVFNLDAAGGKVSPVHPGAPDNKLTHKIIWAPYGEGQLPGQVPEGNWSSPDVTMPNAEVDNYLIKAGLQHAEYLSWPNKRTWVDQHRTGKWFTVNTLTKQADEAWLAHDAPSTPTPVWTENIEPAKVYTAHLEAFDATTNWPVSALKAFIEDHADDPSLIAVAEQWTEDNGGYTDAWKGTWNNQKAVVQLWLDSKQAEADAKIKVPKYHLTTAPGEQPATAMDQFGHEFTFRPGDDFAVEPAVSALASAWGFRMPSSYAVTLEDGTPGLVTAKPDVSGTLAGKSAAGLSAKQASDVAREHVLDWVLASPYGHAGNLLTTPDGGVIASGKPGALSALGWDGLSGTDEADEYAKLAITGLFSAIRSHEIPEGVADEAAKAAITTARRMSQMQDYRMAGYLIAARGETPETASEATKELVGALVTRKATLGEDIEDLWKGVYDAAGWKMPEIPKEALPFGLHSGFSEPTYFDHVIASKSFGVPAFFGGTTLEDGHFLTWTELSGDNRLIRAEGQARGAAKDALTAWCVANQTHGTSSAGSAALSTMTQSVVDPNQPKGDSAVLQHRPQRGEGRLPARPGSDVRGAVHQVQAGGHGGCQDRADAPSWSTPRPR